MGWWGTFEFDDDQRRCWQVGPATLWVRRAPGEWRIAWAASTDPTLDEVGERPGHSPPDAEAARSRVAGTASTLTLEPALPDRPIVARPDTAFRLLPRDAVTLFLSSPLWVRITTEEDRLIADLPSLRSSDTWFGPSPMEGELCYMSRTQARLHLDGLRRARIMTEVKLINRADTAVELERVKLPVQALSLWVDANGALWTPPITVTRTDAQAQLDVAKSPGPRVAKARQVAPPRIPGPNVFVRALHALVS